MNVVIVCYFVLKYIRVEKIQVLLLAAISMTGSETSDLEWMNCIAPSYPIWNLVFQFQAEKGFKNHLNLHWQYGW